MRTIPLLTVAGVLIGSSARAESTSPADGAQASQTATPLTPSHPPAPKTPPRTRMRSKEGFYIGASFAGIGTFSAVAGLAGAATLKPSVCQSKNGLGCGWDATNLTASGGDFLLVIVGGTMVLGGGVTMLVCGLPVADDPAQARNTFTLRPRVELGVASARATWRF